MTITTTTIFEAAFDSFDNVPTIRLKGEGDMPSGAFQSESFADRQWTAWYRAGDWEQLSRVAVLPPHAIDSVERAAFQECFGKSIDEGEVFVSDLAQAMTHALINAEHMSCGCYACDERPQQGHFACCEPSRVALALERLGFFSRAYDGEWRWYGHAV